ncbi:hypothetical protein [Bacillus sp. FSL K6-1000]|uniref:hypothetical protein n=1 Tax=Bacillus sp. FSL K6-1000 TaxID=2921458 RepID=UPI003159F0DA
MKINFEYYVTARISDNLINGTGKIIFDNNEFTVDIQFKPALVPILTLKSFICTVCDAATFSQEGDSILKLSGGNFFATRSCTGLDDIEYHKLASLVNVEKKAENLYTSHVYLVGAKGGSALSPPSAKDYSMTITHSGDHRIQGEYSQGVFSGSIEHLSFISTKAEYIYNGPSLSGARILKNEYDQSEYNETELFIKGKSSLS